MVGVACLTASAAADGARERPNFVLLVSEDNSVHYMDHFFPGGAVLPNIESLAANGITFDRAFSNSPVCSVARTTVITGVYAPRNATHHHRRLARVNLTSFREMFPRYLREAGYYTIKNGKKDFNATEGEIWDEDGGQAHWRNRPGEDMPFFYMEQTGNDTHEGRVHFDKDVFRNETTSHDPDAVEVFPYLPDTELVRYTHAYYLDRHLELDEKVGEVLAELERDGLRENTIVIYYGDHGGVLPRSKGYVYESGVHVPMVVHVPEKFRHLSPFDPGSRVEGFVEFVDLGPTILNLAGAGLPPHMDGRPFLGSDVTAEQVAERDETFSYADRFDEKYDMVRALRKGDFKYMRNYWPHYPDALVNAYRHLQLAYPHWHELYQAGELNEVQRRFFEPRSPEALYDLASDPHETRNLAGDPEYAEVLEDMRGRLRRRMRSLPDLGVFPESYLLEHAVGDPYRFGEANVNRVTRLLGVADLVLQPFEKARPALEAAMEAEDPWERYWGLIACAAIGEDALELEDYVRRLASDDVVPVRIRAAETLGVFGVENPMPVLYEAVAAAENQSDALLALNTMAYLRDFLGFEVDPDRIVPREGIGRNQLDRRLEHLVAGSK